MARLFEADLSIAAPWFVTGVRFEQAPRVLTDDIGFTTGSRFVIEGVSGEHSIYDTVIKTSRHQNVFQHGGLLQARTPQVKPPEGAVRLTEPLFTGKLCGFTPCILAETQLVYLFRIY